MRSTNDATSSGVSDECRADHLCDHGMVRVALGTDDDALGHGWVAMVIRGHPEHWPSRAGVVP